MAGKRANGEGSIYKRSDGRWAAIISLGRGRRKHFFGKTRQEVAAKLNAALKARQDGLPVPGERRTLEEFLKIWLEGVHPKVVSEMLGHSQIAITLDLYSHVTPTMQRGAAEEMEIIVSG